MLQQVGSALNSEQARQDCFDCLEARRDSLKAAEGKYLWSVGELFLNLEQDVRRAVALRSWFARAAEKGYVGTIGGSFFDDTLGKGYQVRQGLLARSRAVSDDYDENNSPFRDKLLAHDDYYVASYCYANGHFGEPDPERSEYWLSRWPASSEAVSSPRARDLRYWTSASHVRSHLRRCYQVGLRFADGDGVSANPSQADLAFTQILKGPWLLNIGDWMVWKLNGPDNGQIKELVHRYQRGIGVKADANKARAFRARARHRLVAFSIFNNFGILFLGGFALIILGMGRFSGSPELVLVTRVLAILLFSWYSLVLVSVLTDWKNFLSDWFSKLDFTHFLTEVMDDELSLADRLFFVSLNLPSLAAWGALAFWLLG